MTTAKDVDGMFAELRREIAATREAGATQSVADEVRVRAVGLARAEKARGRTMQDTARLLGVHGTTLSKWMRGVRGGPLVARSAADFRPVKPVATLTAPPPSSRPAAPPPSPPPLAAAPSATVRLVHAASGLIVEGLDVEGAAALLRRLTP